MAKKPRRWKGELAKPIRPEVVRPGGLAVTDAKTVARANKKMNQLYQQAINNKLLMEHYGIPNRADYFNLALALAIDHIPGFQIDSTPLQLEHGTHGAVIWAKRAGRHREWTPERLKRLRIAVEEEKQKDCSLTDRTALSIIARRREWERPANHRRDQANWIETLESRLQDARKAERMIQQELKAMATIARKLRRNRSGNFKPV
jgi:hypothetical protein